MRICVLSTGTNNCDPLYKPFGTLGHDLSVLIYDDMTHAEHQMLPGLVRAANPDLIYYIGAIEGEHGKPVPHVDILAEIGKIAPMVHICCDGNEPLWWDQLARYYDRGRFALQVNIDGVRSGPIGERGLTTLCPIDTDLFPDVPWSKRPYWCGFSGGLHYGRGVITELRNMGVVQYRAREPDATYQSFIDFQTKFRIGISVAYTGGGSGLLHCKARAATEIPASGGLVLDTEGSPLKYWFDLGDDYIEYRDATHAARQIEWARQNQAKALAMANRMRLKVMQRHSPAIFLNSILYRLGMQPETVQAREVPFVPWGHSAPPPPAPPQAQPKDGPGLGEPGEKPETHADAPILLDSLVKKAGAQPIERTNLVAYQGFVYALPQRLGPVHLEYASHRKRDGVREFPTLEAARKALA